MKTKNVTIWVIAIAAVLMLLGPLTSQSRGDFVLTGNQELTVNSLHYLGALYDRSRASIVPGGVVCYLNAYDFSVVDVSGGTVGWLLGYHSSAVDISGGTVSDLFAYESTVVDISGGNVGWLYACNYSTVDISGGSVGWLYAYDWSVVSFYGQNFSVGEGLSLYDDRVLGTGWLSGEWFDGTPWSVNIYRNAPTVTILAIPEPATLLLFGLGAVIVRKRRVESIS